MAQRIKLLCAERDRERLAPILAALGEKGLKVEDGAAAKSDVVLAALSASFYADDKAKEKLLGLIGAGADKVLPLQLDETPMPDALKNALYARNIIPAAGRDAKLITERIVSALPKKKPLLPLLLSTAAILLAAVVGLTLWKQRTPAEEPLPAIATEAPIEASVAIPAGLTEEDLASVVAVYVIGEEMTVMTLEEAEAGGEFPATHTMGDEGMEWYSKADGHRYQTHTYTAEELEYLRLLPNLEYLFLGLADCEALPDLGGLTQLSGVDICDSNLRDIGFLRGAKANYIGIFRCPVENYAVLNTCENLSSIWLEFEGYDRADLSQLAPPALEEALIRHAPEVDALDLSGLSGCSQLRILDFMQVPVKDLSFLSALSSLEELSLDEVYGLRDLSGLAGCKQLRKLTVDYCDELRDYTPIGACTALEWLEIHTDRSDVRLQDASFLAELPKLNDLSLYGVELRDMNFLESYGDREMSLSFSGDIQDYSGLAYVKRYGYLHINPRYNTGRTGRGGDVTPILPYIQDATINNLMLYACANVDLAALPEVTGVLSFVYGDLSDLRGLQAYPLRKIELENCNYLRSLEGLEALPGLREEKDPLDVNITGCPHLTNWSALEGSRLDQLTLKETYMLPDLGTIDMNRLRLDGVVDLEDLSCLDAISFTHELDLELENLTELRDLTPVFRFHGEKICVPAHLVEQGQELIENGNYKQLSVSYPEAGWQQDMSPIALLSLEELETLPRSVLKRVERIAIAEDGVLDMDRFEVDNRWEDGRQVPVLRERDTGEERALGAGVVTDLSLFEKLSGLRELYLIGQPIGDLNGVQNLASLQRFTADFCTELNDVSPLFALQDLEQISLRYSGASSIRGIQNLSRLVMLDISGTAVTDLSPLGGCDFAYAMDCGGFDFSANELEIDAAGFEALGKIGHFSSLAFVDQDPALWIPALRDSQIQNFGAANDFRSNEDLAAFCADHGELESLYIGYSAFLTDLTPLLQVENLQHVTVNRDMEEAIASLDGQEYGFELEIQG